MSAIQPRFSQVNLIAGDPEASLAFYRALGIEIADSEVWRTHSGTHHITAQRSAPTDGAAFEIDSATFAREWNFGWKEERNLTGRIVLGFNVLSRADVDATYDKVLAAGFRGLQPPYDAIWGARYAVLEDPNGIAVGIMSPITAEHRSPPPAI